MTGWCLVPGSFFWGPWPGPVVGLSGAWLMVKASEKGLTSDTLEGIGAIALSGCAYLLAGEIGGNGVHCRVCRWPVFRQRHERALQLCL